MAIDLFDPRDMAQMLSQQKPPRTFVRDMFFPIRTPRDTEYIDYDVEDHVRKLAPFTNPNLAGPAVDQTGFVTSTFTPPTVSQKMVTTAEQLMKRQPGEPVYGGLSPDERASQQLGRNLASLDNMITRREEWMCCKALWDGIITILGEGVNKQVNFNRAAGNTIALMVAARRWDASTAKIEEDLNTWKNVVLKACGVAPNVAILGGDAADAFMSNSAMHTVLDTLRADLGQIDPANLPNGATYLGRFKRAGLDVYAYNEWFVDPVTLVETPMIGAKEVMLGSTLARTELLYGACPIASGTDGGSGITLMAGTRVPDSWIQKEPAARIIKVTSRPLPVPIQVNAFLKATVVA